MKAKDFADSPPNAIANHRAAQSFFDAGAEAGVLESIPPKEDDKLPTRAPLAATVHRFKVCAAHQANGAGPVSFVRRSGRARVRTRWA